MNGKSGQNGFSAVGSSILGQAPTDYRFKENFIIIFYIRNKIYIFFDQNFENSLMRVFLLIWVNGIIKKPA